MKKLLREPLLHFLALGGAIFVLNEWRSLQKPSAGEAPRIEINAAVIERLRAGYERQSGHSPDSDELRGLVTAHIREEVLYREALAIGLDRDDTIVRRRMAQKMEFLTDDIVGAEEPDDAALQQFFATNATRYAKPTRVTFRHVYFSKEKRGASADAAAREAQAALAQGTSEESLGDAFLHGFEFQQQEPHESEALFGREFAAGLLPLPVGKWTPLASCYGTHLIYVVSRGEARPAKFPEVREVVTRDFTEERRRAANREVFERLLERYRVTVDEAALTRAKVLPTRTAQR